MLEAQIEQRVTNLEELMAQLVHTVDRLGHRVNQTQRQIDRLTQEMADFKN